MALGTDLGEERGFPVIDVWNRYEIREIIVPHVQ